MPRNRPRARAGEPSSPRILSLTELEAARDDLVAKVGAARDALDAQARSRQASRVLLKRMTEAPQHFHWAAVTTADLGEPGCRTWESVPRLGPIGLLANWWQIRVSSGCP